MVTAALVNGHTSENSCNISQAPSLRVEALIKANKDFDLVVFPSQAHGHGNQSNYMMRKRWDYFVKWLLNSEPPKELMFEGARGMGFGG